ncbi:hypothetical protein SAVIM338S_00441 [Streptomyces avidinii]
MPTESDTIELSEDELRRIAGYAAECARRVLPLFERDLPADTRPRDALDAAEAFAGGGRRTNALRQSAWAAYKAAQEAQAARRAPGVREAASPASPAPSPSAAAVDAARAASHAAAAAYLHPKASAHQVKHILGAAAHAARAEELAGAGTDADTDAASGAGTDADTDAASGAGTVTAVGAGAGTGTPSTGTLEWARHHAPAAVTAVLGRLPAAPPGGGRVGEFIRALDAALRA